MDRFEEFEKRINHSLGNMEAKISFLHESTGQLKTSFNEFKDEMGDFMKFIAEHITDHEQRLSRIEKHLNL